MPTRIRNPKPKFVTIPVDLGPETVKAIRKLADRDGVTFERKWRTLLNQRLALLRSELAERPRFPPQHRPGRASFDPGHHKPRNQTLMKFYLLFLSITCLSGLVAGCQQYPATGGAYGYAHQMPSDAPPVWRDPIHRLDDCNRRQVPQCGGGF